MNFNEAIYHIVCQIPKGCVATYGQIAILAGYPRHARQVGWALHKNPRPILIPCHRVVFADGRLAKGFAFGGLDGQATLLLSEGVAIQKGRVDLAKYRWRV